MLLSIRQLLLTETCSCRQHIAFVYKTTPLPAKHCSCRHCCWSTKHGSRGHNIVPVISCRRSSCRQNLDPVDCYCGHCQCRKTRLEQPPVFPLSTEYVEPSIISVTDMETNMETEMVTAMVTKRAGMSYFPVLLLYLALAFLCALNAQGYF